RAPEARAGAVCRSWQDGLQDRQRSVGHADDRRHARRQADGGLKRTVTGESLFLTHFRADGPAEVGVAGNYPGRLTGFELPAGRSILAQRDAFLFAQPTVQFNIALVKRLGAGFFGGEGFILEKFTGPGAVFIHAGGDFVEFDLVPGQTLQVDTGCIVAFDETVDYDIQFVGGIKTALFGGEGLFLATLT